MLANQFTEALRLYGSRLTAYERLEIEHYPEIWYLGLDARKIHGEEGAPQNGGYDDENGSYHKVRTQCTVLHVSIYISSATSAVQLDNEQVQQCVLVYYTSLCRNVQGDSARHCVIVQLSTFVQSRHL